MIVFINKYKVDFICRQYSRDYLTGRQISNYKWPKIQPCSPPFLKGAWGIFWKFEFGYSPSTRLRVVSLLKIPSLSRWSNHLLFVNWCLACDELSRVEFLQSRIHLLCLNIDVHWMKNHEHAPAPGGVSNEKWQVLQIQGGWAEFLPHKLVKCMASEIMPVDQAIGNTTVRPAGSWYVTGRGG